MPRPSDAWLRALHQPPPSKCVRKSQRWCASCGTWVHKTTKRSNDLMTKIVVVPPSPRVQQGVDEVLSAVIAAGGEYRGWSVDDMVADVLGEYDPELNDAVACVIRRDHGRAIK